MERYWYWLFVFIFAFLFVPLFCFFSYASLTINEIYPAPISGEFEWVEMYNTEDKTIDVSQYQLLDIDGHKIKIATYSASPLGFILSTSSAVLNNNGDTIVLKNSVGDVIDVATYSGTFDSAKSFTKCPDGGNQWFSLNYTTKAYSNEAACLYLTPTPTPIPPTAQPTDIPSATSTPLESPTATSTGDYDFVYISEVYPYPQKDEDEWVEIYNANDREVMLSKWKIDDRAEGGSSPRLFDLTLQAKQYGVISFSSSFLNNSGDSVRLLNNLEVEKDNMEYTGAKQGMSFGRADFENDTYCLQLPSKNSANNMCKDAFETHPSPIPSQKNIISSVQKKQPPSAPVVTLQNPHTITTQGYPQVLGNSVHLQVSYQKRPSPYPYLSFVAISYALLTLVSVFVKIKYADSS